MTTYRRNQLDLSTRLELARQMLKPERVWGEVSQLARQYQVSRKFLYELGHRAERSLLTVLPPQAPGRHPVVTSLTIDAAFVRRAMVILATVVPGTVRSIQAVLELLLKQHRAVGTISQTLQAAGEQARQYQAGLALPLAVLGEADEIFQGRQPCLTVVDGRSFLVLNLSAEDSRDTTTWGVTFLELLEQGVQFQDVTADGARGIRAGAAAAGLAMPVKLDLFHLLQEGHRLSRQLESQAYQAMLTAERASRAEREQQAPVKRRGRRLIVQLSPVEAERQADQAVARYDLWQWLLGEVRQALEPVTRSGQLASPERVRQTLTTAAELMQSLVHSPISRFAQQNLLAHLDDLLAPLTGLVQALAPWRTTLDPAREAFLLWVWQHRQSLNLIRERDFPAAWQPLVTAFWQALELFHRASSLAEALHSWLRPYLQVHRGIPTWLLPLLQLYWNHHSFQRGKRQGQAPLTLAGLTNSPSLVDLFDLICQPPVSS